MHVKSKWNGVQSFIGSFTNNHNGWLSLYWAIYIIIGAVILPIYWAVHIYGAPKKLKEILVYIPWLMLLQGYTLGMVYSVSVYFLLCKNI